jgi:hypothetical protein
MTSSLTGAIEGLLGQKYQIILHGRQRNQQEFLNQKRNL